MKVEDMTDEELIVEIKKPIGKHNVWYMEGVEDELQKRGYDVEEYTITIIEVTKRAK
jgi:hypothetical protein